MTLKEAMKYEYSVIMSAEEWVNGKTEINQEELAIIAGHYGQRLPNAFRNFISSKSPQEFKAYSGFETISRTLESLAKKIRRGKGK